MNTNINLLLFYIDDETRTAVEKAVATIDGTSLLPVESTSFQQLDEIDEERYPEVVICEINPEDEEYVAKLESVIEAHKDICSFYVTSQDDDMAVVRRLMRAGARDFLPQPIHFHELQVEMTRLTSEKRDRLREGKNERGGIVGFLNAKGGVGATTLAVNLAYELAQYKDAKTLLIDLDVQFGSAAHFLDLIPQTSIIDVLTQPERIDPVFIDALVTKHHSGLHVLAAPGGLTSMSGINASAIKRCLDSVAESYDFVVLDIPRVFTEWTIEAMKYSKPLMLVCQNELPAIRDAKLILDNFPYSGVPVEHVELVNNRAMAKNSSVSIDKLKETLGKGRIHRIRNDFEAAMMARDQGLPIAEVAKKSNLRKDIMSLAEQMYNARYGHEAEKGGFFHNLFSH